MRLLFCHFDKIKLALRLLVSNSSFICVAIEIFFMHSLQIFMLKRKLCYSRTLLIFWFSWIFLPRADWCIEIPIDYWRIVCLLDDCSCFSPVLNSQIFWFWNEYIFRITIEIETIEILPIYFQHFPFQVILYSPLDYFLLFSFLCCYVKNVLLHRVNSLFADMLSYVTICSFLIF